MMAIKTQTTVHDVSLSLPAESVYLYQEREWEERATHMWVYAGLSPTGHDMTPLEQAEHRRLIMELKRRRGESRSNEQWVIGQEI